MSSQEFDHPDVDHPELRAFARVAEEFCHLVEERDRGSRREFIHALHRVLPELYGSGLRLPSTRILWDEGPDSDDNDCDSALPTGGAADVEGADWAQLERSLAEIFGERNLYREISDPFISADEEAEVLGSLSDDIADVYRDLKLGLVAWHRGETGAALWEWRFGLESHWGDHVTGAIRALHARAAWWDTWFPPS